MADEDRDTKLDVGKQRTERLKRKRRTIRSSTTKLLNQIDVELLKEDPDVGRGRKMLAMLSAKEDSFCEPDGVMEEHASLEDVEAEIELAGEYRYCIISMKTQAHGVLRAHETVSNNVQPALLSDVSANSARSQHSIQSVRLTKLTVENFNVDASMKLLFIAMMPVAREKSLPP